jgi:hypothetical protein
MLLAAGVASPKRSWADAPESEDQGSAESSNYSWRIGGAEFKVGGMAQFLGVWRDENTGNGIATLFGQVPYNNTIQGNQTDGRFSAQASQLNLKVKEEIGGAHATAYFEGDFLGNSASNNFVTTNSNTFRMRHYWLDVRRGDWEVLAGQAWSWLTPNRKGVSPENDDVFYTRNLDQFYQVGLTWTRAAQIRAAYHSGALSGGLALESPDPFVGVGEVIYPFGLNAQLSAQADAGNVPGAPTLFPDMIGKVALDDKLAGHRAHLEAVALGRVFRTSVLNVAAGSNDFSHYSTLGWGASVNGNVELSHGLDLIVTTFYSKGGGRYLGGLGPDFIVNANGAPVTVLGAGGTAGLEARVTKKTLVAAYYGRVYFDNNSFIDATNPTPFAHAGFGGINSPNSANKKVEETTVDVIHDLWKDSGHGALQLVGQLSYVNRTAWFIPAGAPTRAYTDMVFAGIQYLLP